ncbi:SLAM family member 9-like isoform X1 [Labeo rohita]|uniref:SLAM family member 9-like isoform X1 n=1 Tax=Labeo rohita TaxID=84645 RepID=A0A498L4A2_LABRO|nr:SLAM family member 9-like isoform X1 [Labeo rohita]
MELLIFIVFQLLMEVQSYSLTITEQKNPMSEYTQIIYCLQHEDLPEKPLLDVGRTETTVNYYHSEIQKADLRKISLTPRS